MTGEWIEGSLPADVTIPVGTWDAALGRTYVQIAREGWGEQKSQNGGANPALSGPDSDRAITCGLWLPRLRRPSSSAGDASLFENRKVKSIPASQGLARLVRGAPPASGSATGWAKSKAT